MLESEVPPCCTITLDGGQLAAAFPAVGGGAEDDGVAPVAAWLPVAGELAQLEEATRFLCRLCLPVLGGVLPEDVLSGAVAGGVAALGRGDEVDGFCAGGAAP